MNNRRSQLVLLGAGLGHLQVLRDWSQRLHKGVELTVITPSPQPTYSPGLSAWVNGECQASDINIALEPWIKACGARWIQDRCIGLDVHARTIQLRNEPERLLHFDWLSINTGSSMGLQQLEDLLPGAKGRVLPVRPVEQFMDYWARALETAKQRPMAVGVIGAGAAGVELALALKRRLSDVKAQASVSLIAGDEHWLAAPGSRARRLAERALQQAHIQVLHQKCTQVGDGELCLDNGMRLACDLPIVTTGSMAPPWLRNSGLALDAHGYVAVNAHQQSTSHLRVFALGDVATRVDRPHAKNAAYALHAGQQHAQTLWAAIQGLDLKPIPTPRRLLQFMNTSDGRATVQWGDSCINAGWVLRWKRSRDEAQLAALRHTAEALPPPSTAAD